MLTLAQIKNEIEWLGDFGGMIQAYEEIAALRMQEIRAQVLVNRDFLNSLSEIFQQVKTVYKKQAVEHKLISRRRKNGQTARVFLSANTGLYGSIVQETFLLFLQDLEKYKSEPVVVGRLGQAFFQEARPGAKYTAFDFPDVPVDNSRFKEIVNFLVGYETVVVYHGYFKNLVTQIPRQSNISGDELIPQTGSALPARWIFEPSLDEVLTLFDNEILGSLFIQTMHESQLAKYASRMMTLGETGENVKGQLQKQKLGYSRLNQQQANEKQSGMFSSMTLWRMK